MILLSRDPHTRVFRNQTGTYKLEDGRVLSSGLHKGSADLIGWKELTITPEMVGSTVAVFLSVEVKSAKGRVRPEQETWKNNVNRCGGIAIVARSAEDAQSQIREKCLTLKDLTNRC